jgi:hypothetical protein
MKRVKKWRLKSLVMVYLAVCQTVRPQAMFFRTLRKHGLSHCDGLQDFKALTATRWRSKIRSTWVFVWAHIHIINIKTHLLRTSEAKYASNVWPHNEALPPRELIIGFSLHSVASLIRITHFGHTVHQAQEDCTGIP